MNSPVKRNLSEIIEITQHYGYKRTIEYPLDETIKETVVCSTCGCHGEGTQDGYIGSFFWNYCRGGYVDYPVEISL